jgi:Fusaric acid resistance protein family
MHTSAASLRLSWSLPQALAALGPPLLFAIRLWASVCLALFTAFWLELDSSNWAGGMAAIVCQPQLGASLRKGWFRMIGTIVGALLTACFPQDRVGYLGSLALFCRLFAFAATVLRNFASYAAALAGTTAAIIAANLGATGGASPDVFLVAINRASDICIAVQGIKNRLAGSQSREAIGLTGGWTLWHSTMTIVTASIVVTHSAA